MPYASEKTACQDDVSPGEDEVEDGLDSLSELWPGGFFELSVPFCFVYGGFVLVQNLDGNKTRPIYSENNTYRIHIKFMSNSFQIHFKYQIHFKLVISCLNRLSLGTNSQFPWQATCRATWMMTSLTWFQAMP